MAALIIEPLGSAICGRCKPDIAERSQVIYPQMIDPSGSTISAAKRSYGKRIHHQPDRVMLHYACRSIASCVGLRGYGTIMYMSP
jgi:hypothetical protein